MNVNGDDFESARALRSALAKLTRRLRAQGDSAGIGTTALSLLGRLWRDGPSTAAVLAAKERLQPQSLTRTLKVLEARDLIGREADELDRRRSTITITLGGVNVLRTFAYRREAWLSQAMAATLSDTERDVLRIAIPIIERLADADE